VEEAGAVGAVDGVADGGEVALGVEAEGGVALEELADEFAIFFGFEAAGAVVEGAAGADAAGGGIEEGELGAGEAGDFGGAEAPAEFDAAAEDAGVGAGGINEDMVEGVAGGEGGEVGGDGGGSEAGGVFGDLAEAGGIGIAGEDAALVIEELGEEHGFAAGGGAEVEDGFAGAGSEEGRGEEGAGVLDVEEAAGEGGEGGEGGMVVEAEDVHAGRPITVSSEFGVFDGFGAPGFEELGAGGAEGVQAGIGGGRGVVPAEEGEGGFAAELFFPALEEPLGVGEAEVGVGFAEGGEGGAGGFGFAAIGAEEGVDEAGLGEEAELFADFDGFIDDGVGGDAVEPEHLVEGEAEEVLDGAFLGFAAGFAGDEPIEGSFPADGAKDEFLEEAAVFGLEGGALGGGIEQVFDESSVAALEEEADGNLPWILGGHGLIMPLVYWEVKG